MQLCIASSILLQTEKLQASLLIRPRVLPINHCQRGEHTKAQDYLSPLSSNVHEVRSSQRTLIHRSATSSPGWPHTQMKNDASMQRAQPLDKTHPPSDITPEKPPIFFLNQMR